MARIRQLTSNHTQHITSRAAVGRSPDAEIFISDPYVSSVHAELYWDGGHWIVKDLNSRNGTWVDGHRLSSPSQSVLAVGSRLAFGQADQIWIVDDIEPPKPYAFSGEEVADEVDGILVIPSVDDPQVVVFSREGLYYAEDDETVRSVENGDSVFAAGRRWTLSIPSPPTNTIELPSVPHISELELHFETSEDERDVQLHLSGGTLEESISHRAHSYLLLLLAKARAEDAENGVSPSEAGWRDVSEMLTVLDVPSNHLNMIIHRARQQFHALRIPDAAQIIERRRQLKTMRIGCSQLRFN